MDNREAGPTTTRGLKASVSVCICLAFIVIGMFAMGGLTTSKASPKPKAVATKGLSFTTIEARPGDVVLHVLGYGEANPLRVSHVAPEVSGRVIKTSPNLKVGGRVQEGELLMQLDNADYVLAARKAEINVQLRANDIQTLKVSSASDTDRLTTLARNTSLAREEFLRLKTLYETEEVGTLSGVEQAEQSYNTLLETEKILKKNIRLYPLQISEAQNNLADAQADLDIAGLDETRCNIRAPFTGRIKEKTVEQGNYVTTGTSVLTLADDTALEILVPLSEAAMFERLPFMPSDSGTSWFSTLENRSCTVETITGNETATVTALVDRIASFDPETRTVVVAVRVDGKAQKTDTGPVTLVDGMFCRVIFTGKTLANVLTLPTDVIQNGLVYLVEEGRIKAVTVERIMEDGDRVYIKGNIPSGAAIVTTKVALPVNDDPVEVTTVTPSREGESS